MARFIPRKSLLVLGLLATVLGSSAATAVAATAHPAGPAPAAAKSVTATTSIAKTASAETASAKTVGARLTAAKTVPAGVLHPAAGAAYPQAFLTAVIRPATAPPGTGAPAAEPVGGICSVPGIGDIGNLLNLCHGGGFTGDLNNICQPSLPQPEPASGGIDAIIRPPASPGPQGKTLYDNYGVAGQFWAATDMQCSDMTSMIGNNVAGMVFDAAKAVDRVTITVYQSAAGNGILAWLSGVVDRLISSLGNAIYFPYLAPVVLLGVMWLAWHGLIRKRATRTIEGTIWMVVACAAAIWLIGRPADFTGVGQAVSNGVTQVLNVAFSKLPNPGQGDCVPVHGGDPQSPGGASFGFTQGNGLVDQNANELWSVLVCKPWLDGEFGTTQFSTGRTGQTPVNTYGRQLLWAQAIAANETPTAALIKAKQTVYSGIAASIKAHDPAIYPLFQGNQWTSRLEIGFAGLFAALVAGVLVLLIAITLIILKLGFLLLLIAGPFFLIVGTHPGFGRVVATRWFEMLVGVLLKSVAVAIVLSVLLYAYSLIMGTSDSVLPWALKILMIALVTIAVFIYRKPFQHLFSAVGYGSIGARERAELEIYRSREVLRRNATGVAAAAVGGFTGYSVGRLARRGAPSTALAEHIALAAGSGAPDAGPRSGPMPNGQGLADPNAPPDGAEPADGQTDDAGVRAGARGQGRTWAAADVEGSASAAPPLHLSARGVDEVQADAAGWARGGVDSAGVTRPLSRTGAAPPRPTGARTSWPAAGSGRAVSGAGSPAAGAGTASGPPRQAGNGRAPAPQQAAIGRGAAPRQAGNGRSPAPRQAGNGRGPAPQQAGNGRGPAPRLPATAGPVARLGSAAGPAPWVGHAPGPAPAAGHAAGPPARTGTASGAIRASGGGSPVSGAHGAAGPPARTGTIGGPGQAGSAGGPARAGGRGPAPTAGGAVGPSARPGSAAPVRAGGGGGPMRAGNGGGPVRAGNGGGPVRAGNESGPSWGGSAGGPRPRSAGPGPGPAPTSAVGQPRARWGSETAQGSGDVPRSGRPLWQPGPIRTSGGWSGGGGARSTPEPRTAPAPRSGPVSGAAAAPRSGPASRSAAAPASRSAAAPRSGPVSGAAAAPRSGPASRSAPAPRSAAAFPASYPAGPSAPAQPRPQHSGRPPAYPATGPASGDGPALPPQRSRGRGIRPGRAAPGSSNPGGTVGNGTANSPDAVSSGREEAIRRETPLPFWLRPVRRKK
ncbi:MAG TPA: type IV secretion system protein [Streptosporangiaceae bacterium]